MAVKKAPAKKVVAKKSPTKKSSIKKKPQSSEDPIFKREVNSISLADRQKMEESVRKKMYGTRKPSLEQLTKSTGKLSGRAMRGGKRMLASKLDGM